ncbi:MAG: hypothetical protein NVSMB4_09040 [Acidimicrobiales bacterium]
MEAMTMTAKKRSEIEQVRRASYKLSRGLGDYQALTRSPTSYLKRRTRRYATRTLFSLFR